jgi:histidinol-phosphate aminotransferase
VEEVIGAWAELQRQEEDPWILSNQESRKGHSPYVPGKSINEVARELGLTHITKLASNENVIGPSPLAIKAIQRHLQEIHRYPEDSSYDLKQALARRLRVRVENILLGTGADEVLLLLGQLFSSTPATSVSTPIPLFRSIGSRHG